MLKGALTLRNRLAFGIHLVEKKKLAEVSTVLELVFVSPPSYPNLVSSSCIINTHTRPSRRFQAGGCMLTQWDEIK